MDPFLEARKLSVPAIVFGALALSLGWLIYVAADPLIRLMLGETALVFLVLFFYELVTDRIEDLEQKIEMLSTRGKNPGNPVS